ncbi:MAG: hypothetical protein ABI639_07730 [Thermoanaerobaculia bacterium]
MRAPILHSLSDRCGLKLAAGLACAGLALLAGASPAQAQAAFAFYGSNVGGGTFNRPNATLAPAALSGKITRYSSQALFTNANGGCTFTSVQESGFDGVVYLYRSSFDPSNPLLNLVAVNDNVSGRTGFSDLGTVQLLGNQSYYLVTSGAEPADQGSFTTLVACTGATRILAGDGSMPSYDGRYTELRKGRFRVSATWRNFANVTGSGTFVPLGSEDSGVVWFFNPANFELMIKIIDGCSLNNRYWVFFAALTNVEFHVTVYDTWTDTTKVYDNALGVSAAATTDSSAFMTCP